MKILHTSDWHLGRNLFGRKRYIEFNSFLKWLVTTISNQQIDVLIIAGDIFDTGTPSNRALQLYFQFLKDVSVTSCRHIIIIGGNHDSPTLLDAPKELLHFFHVHVTGSATENIEDEIRVLQSPDGEDELIVCAVPYLRDRDIRTSKAGEDLDDKNRNLLQGIEDHYQAIADTARDIQQKSASSPPIVATGHLFAAGGTKVEGDGVRDLYVGSLVHVNSSVFSDCFDYVALGHLHSAQRVGNNETIRYSGSPLPMSFSESQKDKHVLICHITQSGIDVEPITVPRFQELRTVRGNLDTILSEISILSADNRSIWLEVIYDGEDIVANLQATLHKATEGTSLEILRILNQRLVHSVLDRRHAEETLENMTSEAVFHRCLEIHNIPQEQHDELYHLFRQTLQEIEEEDKRAE